MNWLRKLFGMKPKQPDTFEEWFAKQGFVHFSAKEFTRYFHRAHNSYPPRELWENIVPTLRVLDRFRTITGHQVRITSSYRSPDYNDRVGGAPRSMHLEFRALDFQVHNMSPHECMVILKAWREKGQFKGGLGLYPTFCHIDTRGSNATW